MAEISCISGCICEPHTLDAHHTKKESTTHLHPIAASQSEACLINVTVSNATSCRSGEHKFKLSGLVMLDESPGERL